MASPTDRTLGALIAMRQDVVRGKLQYILLANIHVVLQPGVLQTLSTTQPGTAGSSTRFKPSPDIVQAVLSAYQYVNPPAKPTFSMVKLSLYSARRGVPIG